MKLQGLLFLANLKNKKAFNKLGLNIFLYIIYMLFLTFFTPYFSDYFFHLISLSTLIPILYFIIQLLLLKVFLKKLAHRFFNNIRIIYLYIFFIPIFLFTNTMTLVIMHYLFYLLTSPFSTLIATFSIFILIGLISLVFQILSYFLF